MEVKNFIMISITLIIGVILTSGVVAPVIADVSDDSGSGSGETYTNVRHAKYVQNTNGTSLSYYPYYANEWCMEPDTVADREIYEGGLFFYSTEYGQISVMAQAVMEGPTSFGIHYDGVWYQTSQIDINGKVMSFYDSHSSSTVSFNGIVISPDPMNGNMVDAVYVDNNYPIGENYFMNPAYVYDSTPIGCEVYIGLSEDEGCFLAIAGTIGTNKVSVTESWGDLVIGNTARFNVVDNQIESVTVTINGEDRVCDAVALQNSADYGFSSCVVPVEVTDGSGSGISGTLATVLSVIPLILTVGLVLGAVAFLRMKN